MDPAESSPSPPRKDTRSVARFLVFQVISLFGDNALWVVLAVWVNELTGSAGLAGLIGFAIGVPMLFAPWMGLLVDRFHRKSILAGAQIAGAAAILLLLVVDRGTVWLIFVVAALLGAVSGIVSSAQSAILRDLIGLNQNALSWANGALRTAQQSLRIIAPPIGVTLYSQYGSAVTVWLDAATFAVATAGLAWTRVPDHRHEATGTEDVLTGWTAGARFIRRTPVLFRLVVASAWALIGLGLSSTLVFTLTSQNLHRDPSFVGYLEGAVGVGALLGAPFASWHVNHAGSVAAMRGAIATVAAGFAVLFIPTVPAALVGMGIIGFGVPWSLIALFLTVQTESPPYLQGRVYSTAQMATSVPQTAAVALGAAIVPALGFRAATACIVISQLVAVGYLYLSGAPARLRPFRRPVRTRSRPGTR